MPQLIMKIVRRIAIYLTVAIILVGGAVLKVMFDEAPDIILFSLDPLLRKGLYIAMIVFLLLGLVGLFPELGLSGKIISQLKAQHPAVRKKMGSLRTRFRNNLSYSPRANPTLIRFVMKNEWQGLQDDGLSALCRRMQRWIWLRRVAYSLAGATLLILAVSA